MFQTSRIRFSKLGFRLYATFYCFIPYVSSTFYSKVLILIISHKNLKKTSSITVVFFFFLHVLQTSRIRVSKLGFRCYDLIYCFIPYVSSTFYSKLLSLIISHKNFKKTSSIIRFFFFFWNVLQTSWNKVSILGNRLVFYTLLFFEILF